MHANWRRELWVFAGITAGGVLSGLLTGRPFLMFTIGLALYLFFTLRHLHRLDQWLRNKKRGAVPEAGGVWGAVFDEIRRLERSTGRRQDRLEDMLQRFQSAAAAIPDAMVVLSQTHEIEWANVAAERLLGLHWPRDHRVRIVNLLRNPEFADCLQQGDFDEALQISSPIVPEYTLSIQIFPFGSSQKVIIARDVTHLLRLERLRSEFVANVSHELRTPVTVLTGFLETFREMKDPRSEELGKHLATMHDQALRMQRLVDDLLTLAKLETTPARLHDEIVDVGGMLTSLKELGEVLSGARRHRILVQAEPGLKLRGNKDELHSAFSNLLNNAIRHTPAEGTIRLAWRGDGDGAVLSVSDTGEGIAPQHIPHLTERFYRVDSGRSRATGGTGLGLSIVKHVLLRHEARLEIESRLDHGSDFICLFLPHRVVREPMRRDRAANP